MKTVGSFEANIPEGGINLIQEGALLRIFFDFEKREQQQSEDDNMQRQEQPDLYEAYNVDVQAPFNYGNIVSAIVNDKYSADDVQALSANVMEARDTDSDLADEKRQEYLTEWSDFQNWRTKAKAIAKAVTAKL
jgi:hypothetical protein